MPLIYSEFHQSPSWLPNGHLQSIYPALFRKVKVDYHRERIHTPDDDFLNLDWSFPKPPRPIQQSKLVILSHGLEGDSRRQYIVGMVRLLNAHGYDCLAWNYRSCGGEMNLQPRFYHSGETSDLAFVIEYALTKGYTELYLMGFSLGGNVTLKYLGEQGDQLSSFIKKAVVFSVPMDLSACSHNINKRENWVYAKRFLNTLKVKAASKGTRYPKHIDLTKLPLIKSVWDFDHFFTGPLHGFVGAEDYYQQCSSKYFIRGISIPTLIVNAKNDPLVPFQSLPIEEIEAIPHVWLEITTEGGHCGFKPKKLEKSGVYWSEQRAINFIES